MLNIDLDEREESSSPPRRWWMRAPAWLALALAGLVIPGAVFARRVPNDPLPPNLGQLAPFALVRESGKPLLSADLAGKIWVADFVFLGCTESCPLLTTRMSHLQSVLEEEGKKRGGALGVRFVSFTVDPTNDTPERLMEYAARWHADTSTWAFATGPLSEVQHVIADGFKIAFGKVESGAGAFEMMHGNYFVVVDGQMHIRGYYSTDRPEEMSHLVHDVVELATREGGRENGGSVPTGRLVAKAGPS
jgi:protein SCO1/2